MEKRGRGAPAPSNLAPQQPSGGPRKERRPSMFEKEAVSAAAGAPCRRSPCPLAGGAGLSQRRPERGPERWVAVQTAEPALR